MATQDFNIDYAKFGNLLGSFLISLVVGLVIIFAVEVMRTRYRRTFDYYHTKLLKRHRKVRRRLRIVPPPPQPNSFLGWVPLVYNMGDSEYFRLVGLDAYLLFRFTRLCCLLNVEFVILGMLILTPIYFNGDKGLVYMNKLTLSNLDSSSNFVVAPVVLAWVYCFHFFWLVGNEMKVLAGLKRDFLARGDPGFDRQTSYTAIVEDIPPGLSSTAMLRAYMQELFPNTTCFVSVIMDLSYIRTLQYKRKKALENLEVAIVARDNTKCSDGLNENVNECEERLKVLQQEVETSILEYQQSIFESEYEDDIRLSVIKEDDRDDDEARLAKLNLMMEQIYKHNCYNSCTLGPSSSSFAFFKEDKNKIKEITWWRSAEPVCYKLAEYPLFLVRGTIDVIGKILGYAIIFVGKKISNKDFLGIERDLNMRTGFVTFQTLVSKITACEVTLSNRGFLVSHAPEARDILWSNVAVPRQTIKLRNRVFNIALCVFGLFWSTMVRVIISFRDYIWESLSESGMNPRIKVLFYNYFVTVILLGFIQLLPLLFRFVSQKFIREKSLSEIERRLLSRFFSFQVLNVFFIVSGADIRTLIIEPRQFFNILGTEVPLVATYAATIIIIKLLTGLPLYLFRTINLLRTAYLHLATNTDLRTPRNWRRGAALPPQPLYGNIFPSMMMTMLLSFLFSVLAPFVCIFAVIFFALAGFIFKFLGLWVYLPEFESGGSFARRIFWTLCICIIASHCSFAGYVTLVLIQAAKSPKALLISKSRLLLTIASPLCCASHRHIFYEDGDVTLTGLSVIPLPFMVILWAYRMDQKLQNTFRALSLEIAAYIDRHEHDSTYNTGASRMFLGDIYCQPELQHVSMEPEVELGSKEDVYSGEDSDDGLDKQSDANIELNMGIYKQSRRQTALVVPGWVYSEQPREGYLSTPVLPDFNIVRSATLPTILEIPHESFLCQGDQVHDEGASPASHNCSSPNNG